MEVILYAENPSHYQHLIKKLKTFLEGELYTNFTISLENVDNFEYSLHYLIFSAFCKVNSDYGQIYRLQDFKYHLSLNEIPSIVPTVVELLYVGKSYVHHKQVNNIQEVAQQLNISTSVYLENEGIAKIEIHNHKDKILDYIWNARVMNINCNLQFITKDMKQNYAHYEIFAIYSNKFETIYKTRLDKTRPLVLVLQNIANEHLELIIEYCYKGCITFTQENVESLNNINKYLGIQLTLNMSDAGCNFTRIQSNNNATTDVIQIERPPPKPRPIIVELINKNKNSGKCYIWHEKKCIMVHAIVMKTFCPFFQEIYENIQCTDKDIAVIISTFTYMELKAIVDFIYTGEANLVVGELGIGSEVLHWLGLTIRNYPECLENNKNNNNSDVKSTEHENKIKSEELPEKKKTYLNITCLSSNQGNEMKENELKPSDFICKECEMDFKNEKCLKIHMKSHYPEIYQCKFCDKVFLKRCNLKRHENLHKAPEHQCEICGKCFVSKDYMIEHKRSHTGDKPFVCPICFKRFTGKTGLNHHNRIHDKKKSVLFVCDICGKKFTRQGLWGHMKTHKKEYSCEICKDKSFATPSALKRHVKWVHEKHPPLKCNFCQEEFELKSQLDRHMVNVHYYYNGEFIRRKEYACNKCSQSFHTSVRLQKHINNRHSGKDLHPCSICGKLLSGTSAIKYHMRSHTGERPHSCTFCSKSFTRPDLLKKHTRIHTGERFVCPICTKSFTSKHYLTEHSWTHNISIDPDKYKTEARLPEDSTIFTINSDENKKCTTCDKHFPISDDNENYHNVKTDNLLESTSLPSINDVISSDNCNQYTYKDSFSSSDSLKNNHSSCFISKASYICSNCEILFDTREELNSHYLYCQPIF